MRKTILASIFAVFSFFLIFTNKIFAEELGICAGNSNDPSCKLASFSISSVLGSIVSFVFIVAVILALGFLVYGGIRWITSGGDKEGVAHARGTIIAAILGLVLIILSYFILNFVLIFLGIEGGLGGVTIPSLNKTGGAGGAQPINIRCGNVGEDACFDSNGDPYCNSEASLNEAETGCVPL